MKPAPCPFCKSTRTHLTIAIEADVYRLAAPFYVSCLDCNAQGPHRALEVDAKADWKGRNPGWQSGVHQKI